MFREDRANTTYLLWVMLPGLCYPITTQAKKSPQDALSNKPLDGHIGDQDEDSFAIKGG
jgi:hypothetical protein